MKSQYIFAVLVAGVHAVDLLTDPAVISRFWGQISTYADNPENYFGVDYVGVPDGCYIEQAHLLHRHAQRGPTSVFDDAINDKRFATKLSNLTSTSPAATFSGPLAFLNTWDYVLPGGLLTGIGAATEFTSGVTHWNRYGRLLFNAAAGQVAYNSSLTNGTARPKLVLRTTSQSRIENSQINWALGFFGPSFQSTPDPTIANVSAAFDVVVIPEGGTENNTLASYDACINADDAVIGYLGDLTLENYILIYLAAAAARLTQYAPPGFTITPNDTYAMQSLCAYETGFIGASSFCNLFTSDEWAGFENTLDIEYFYDYAYGNPTGRAQGIGYLQELLARLQNQYITSSNSTVNSTITDNASDFPLGLKLYADFTHDDIIISALTALSLDYLNDPPSISQYPPNPNRRFILSHLTPFGARLVTEVIGCTSTSPAPKQSSSVIYDTSAAPGNATKKFIRMRLNNGILPLNTIRGGACGNATSGRKDGLCDLSSFIASQKNSYALSNFDYACFGNYTVANATGGINYDGTISK